MATSQQGETIRFLYEQGRRDFRKRNLARADLRGAKLQGVDFSAACLIGANLTGANLEGARLLGANLSGAKLAGTQLSDATLDGANLGRANLRTANLHRATYSASTCFPKGFDPASAGMTLGRRAGGPHQCLSDRAPSPPQAADALIPTPKSSHQKEPMLYRGASVKATRSRPAIATESQPDTKKQWMYRGQRVSH